MSLKDKIMKLQTYKMFVGEDTVYVERDDILKLLKQESILDKVRTEIEKQEKWLLQAGCNTYNVDIAFSSIKSVLTESEDKNGNNNL